jgi:hypothetical protein
VPPFDVFDEDNYPSWYSVTAPTSTIEEFLIDVGYGVAPWPVPKPTAGAPTILLYNLVAGISEQIDDFRDTHTEVGFLGENPIKPTHNYPLCCIIKSEDKYKGFMIYKTSDADLVEWRDINASTCSSYVAKTRTKELHVPFCSHARRIVARNMQGCDTTEQALADGYNGCYYCLREHDTDQYE